MKKILCIVLILALLCGLNVTAFAMDISNGMPAASSLEACHTTFANTEFIRFDDTVQTRNTSLPTISWSLAENDYSANLQIVGKSWLYTNYYFRPNGDGRIYVDYNVTADSSTTSLYIGLYDLTKDKLVVEHTAIEVRTTGKSGTMYFYNLVQSHDYAVCFRAHPSSLNGSAVIRH